MIDQYDHWNRPEHLPPVECPLVIKVGEHTWLACERTGHVADRSQELTYRLPSGFLIKGRFEWTYP